MFKVHRNSKQLFISFFLAFGLHAVIIALLGAIFNTRPFSFSLRSNKFDKEKLIRLTAPPKKSFLKTVDSKFKTKGTKDGIKNLNHPDLENIGNKRRQGQKMSIDKLNSLNAPIKVAHESVSPSSKATTKLKLVNDKNDHYFFKYDGTRSIPYSKEQELLKSEAISDNNFGTKHHLDKISGFEIRYERPFGVSEDELNPDEKAYYSFYVRSYKNYLTKIYSNFEKIRIQKPGLLKAFDEPHLLIGKIVYDTQGNIILVKILKSSSNDDLHYFFEETLKQLPQPNPPKIFTQNKSEFSIYYQLQIN